VRPLSAGPAYAAAPTAVTTAAPPALPYRRPPIPVQARRPAQATTSHAAPRGPARRVAPLPLAGAIVSLAAVVAGVLWIVSGSGTPAARVHSASAPRRPAAAAARPAARVQPRRTTPKPAHRTVVASVAPAPAPPSAAALDLQGHELLYNGQVQASIPVLRHAMAAASPSSLTYAYAMYDLAHALRVSGDPRSAVALLVARLKIPDQTDTVKAELVLALQAIARQNGSLPSGGASPAAPGHVGRGPKDKRHGADQAAPAATQD
jgi:hypothetical protein